MPFNNAQQFDKPLFGSDNGPIVYDTKGIYKSLIEHGSTPFEDKQGRYFKIYGTEQKVRPDANP